MVLVRCFGSFRLEVGGRSVDTTSLKPRHQALLHLLAMGAGRPVHREQLVEALWPVHPDPRAAARNLHVAVSSLRRLLEPEAARGASALVVRDGDSYRLAVGPHDDVDVRTFERSLDEARAARAPADGQRAEAALMAALRAYTGELLPGDGPAEWVVKERDRYRMEAANAAQLLAEVRLADHRPRAAAMAAERGVRIDRYVDALWRLLPTAYEQAGDVAAAARARRQYAEVLDELGVRAPGAAAVPAPR
jgi:DNA-binding SARP family transcriptional activator